MGVCWKMDCVDARLRFVATPGCGQKLGRPSQKSGLGMAELSLQTPSAVIKWHSMKFNIPRGSREQVIWEMSVKILNIFWKDKFETINDQRQNPIIEGIRATLPKLKDEMAVRRLRALGTDGLDVPKYLYESGRCAIAHAYADPIIDPDDVSDLRRLSEDLYIVKEIAEHLIETELKVSRSIAVLPKS